jgi:CPA1 family monovalent cation:H+ antiporter
VLEPEIFFLLFIAPLLFLDGWQISRQGLARDKWTILALALGLVVFTVLGAGYFIHWLIPGIPLPVAFALAAILSPTDAVAVSTLAERAPIPRRLLHILQGESLLNDASGLVCMRFAVAAMLTGAFSVGEALRSFAWLAVGGLAVGAVVALLATMGKDWVSRRYGEVTGSQILISLLIPFGAYLLAVRIDASGILAAVAAGLVMNREEQSGRVLAVTRVRRSAVWEAMHFAGSGMVFLLLGEQLPEIFEGAARVVSETGHQRELWLLGYVLAIALALAALRFLWVWATLDLVLFRRLAEREVNAGPSWRLIAATSLAGVRGAITLAGVLTLPLTLLDGTAFPARDLAILLAAGVIVVSILAAQIGLPYLMRGLKLPAESAPQRQEELARAVAAEAAAKAVERALRRIGKEGQDAPLYLDAGSRIIASYQQRVEARNRTGEEVEVARRSDEVERSLRLVALEAERNELYRMARAGRLADELARKLVREIDLQESWFVGR